MAKMQISVTIDGCHLTIIPYHRSIAFQQDLLLNCSKNYIIELLDGGNKVLVDVTFICFCLLCVFAIK